MLRTQSDARLVDLVRAGHASAFEAIVQRYRKQLLAYCSRLLPASRAEDAVQQTFLKAYQAMVSGDADLNLRPWLYRIAHNASLNLLRQNGWSHEQLDENMDGVQRPDQAFELRERLRTTVEAVKALPERQRNAVLLREMDGLTYEQIASALGVGDGAVRQLLHRARATLRAGLTAVTPIGLMERLAAALTSGGDPSMRVAELATGIGVGTGAVKLGAAVLATGVIATGAVGVPLHHSRHAKTARAAEQSLVTPSPGGAGAVLSPARTPLSRADEHRGKGGSGSSGSGSHHRSGDRHGRHHGGGGSGDTSGSGGGSGSGERQVSSGRGGGDLGGGSGSGDRPSGDGGSGRRTSGGGDGGDSHSGSGSGSSGDSGSGDTGSGGDDSAGTPTADQPTQDSSGDGGSGSSDDATVTAPTGTIPQVSGDSGKDSTNSGPGSGKDSGGS
jgi:RNA polymerase sigma factor (sigma-70 family)